MLEFSLQATNAQLHLNLESGLHFVECCKCTLIHVGHLLNLSQLPHDEHVSTLVACIFGLIFKTLFGMSEVMMPSAIKVEIPKYGGIMD